MGAGVVTIGRRQYAAGLYWENSPSGHVAQAAKEAARQAGQQADFFAVRGGNKEGRVPQFGLGQNAAGHKASMPALAACVANQQPGSWAGGFRLREGSVIIIVRDDLIVPDGDQYFVNESEARDRLLQEISFGGLQKVYAPESWAISGSDTMPVSLLLNDRADVKLRQVSTPKSTVLVAGGGVLLALAVGVGIWYQSYLAQEEAARKEHDKQLEELRAAMANHLPTGMQPQPAYPKPERFWEKAPLPMAVVEACKDGLVKVPAVVVGWRLSDIKCVGASLAANWTSVKGYGRPFDGAVINDSATSAAQSIALVAPPVRDHEDLLNQEDITRLYLTQNWPGTIARAPDDPLPPPPPGYQGAWNPPPAPWVKRSFTLTVSELPGDLPSYLQGLPGAMVTDLTYAVGGKWTIQGVIYENRQKQ